MRALLRFLRILFIQDLKQTLAYPSTFWMVSVVIPLYSLTRIFFLESIYAHTGSFVGYSKYEAYVLFGTYSIVQTIAHFSFYNRLAELGNLIRGSATESFDLALIKPVDSQVFGTLGKYNFGNITPFFVGAALVIYGVVNQGQILNPLNIAAYISLTLLGVVLFYLLFLIFNTILFWQPDLQIIEPLYDGLLSFGQYPPNLYTGVVGTIFNLIIPITLMAGVPADFLFGKAPIYMFVVYIGIVAIIFGFSRLFWNAAIKKYSGSR